MDLMVYALMQSGRKARPQSSFEREIADAQSLAEQEAALRPAKHGLFRHIGF